MSPNTRTEVHSSTRKRDKTQEGIGNQDWHVREIIASYTSSCCDPALSATCMLEASAGVAIGCGERRLWTQLMPGAYTDDGSAGRVPWFAVHASGWEVSACLSDYMGWLEYGHYSAVNECS